MYGKGKPTGIEFPGNTQGCLEKIKFLIECVGRCVEMHYQSEYRFVERRFRSNRV